MGPVSSDVNINGNLVHNFGEDGMVFDRVYNLTINNNTVYDLNSWRDPINFEGSKTGTFSVGDVVEMDCDDADPCATGIVSVSGSGTLSLWQTSPLSASFFSPLNQANVTYARGLVINNKTQPGQITITSIDSEHCDCITLGYGGSNIVCSNNQILRNRHGDEAMIDCGAGVLLGGQCLKLNAPNDVNIYNNLIVGGNLTSSNVSILTGGGLANCNINNNTMNGQILMYNLGPGTIHEITQLYNNIIGILNIGHDDGDYKPHIVAHGNKYKQHKIETYEGGFSRYCNSQYSSHVCGSANRRRFMFRNNKWRCPVRLGPRRGRNNFFSTIFINFGCCLCYCIEGHYG